MSRYIEYHDICSAINNQQDGTGMTYEVMDARDIKYEDNTFDLVVDKSTIDALLCGDDAFINVYNEFNNAINNMVWWPKC